MNLSMKTFLQLLHRDWAVFVPTFKDKFINAIIWSVIVILITQHLLIRVGMPADYGAFTAVSNLMSWGFFQVMNNAIMIISDLEGGRSISYELTLPISHRMALLRIGVSNAIQAAMISILFLPISKLILWNNFSLSLINPIKFCIIFILAHLFYGFFGIFLASIIGSMNRIDNIWMRIIFPLWFLGCYQFSWAVLYEASPTIAYISLLNPLVHIMEAARESILGTASVSFWGSCLFLIGATLFFGYIGIKKMMKILDCL